MIGNFKLSCLFFAKLCIFKCTVFCYDNGNTHAKVFSSVCAVPLPGVIFLIKDG